MADFIDSYVEATSNVPSPELYRLWGAITCVSGVLERKTWTEIKDANIYPNLFTLLVGPPASGKTNSIRIIRDLWTRVEGLNMSPDNVTKAALIDALSRAVRTVISSDNLEANIFSSMVVPCSEFGVFLSHHDLEFLSTLNHIWDSPESYIEERRTSGKVEITKPHMIMLAGTQPDFLNSMLPAEAWGMGFTSRLIMVYAPSSPITDLFARGSGNLARDILAKRLNQIFEYQGEFTWSKQAREEINAWNSAGLPPAPTHNKLLHYNNRRLVHSIKLAMISCASRGADMLVTAEDFERAKSWLFMAEQTMPDIFRAMGQKSDVQVIKDLHFHLYRMWSSVALDKRRPLQDKDIYDFLYERVPSERIAKLIEVAEKTGYIRRATYPGEWIPNLVTSMGNVT